MESVESTLQSHHNSCSPHLAAFVCLQQKYQRYLKFSLNAMLFLAVVRNFVSFIAVQYLPTTLKKTLINQPSKTHLMRRES